MNQELFVQFCDNPASVLNAGANVRQLRLDGSVSSTGAKSTSRVVHYSDSVPLYYQYAAASKIPITIRYDDTGLAPTSAIWISRNPPASSDYQRSTAYYLPWGVNQAYAIELACDAQFFFTAELTGCGLLVFRAPGKMIVVHHNIQPPHFPVSFMRRILESKGAQQRREALQTANFRMESLSQLSQHIVESTSGITGGTLLSVAQYGATARVFGVNKNGNWNFYVNRIVGGIYQTELLLG